MFAQLLQISDGHADRIGKEGGYPGHKGPRGGSARCSNIREHESSLSKRGLHLSPSNRSPASWKSSSSPPRVFSPKGLHTDGEDVFVGEPAKSKSRNDGRSRHVAESTLSQSILAIIFLALYLHSSNVEAWGNLDSGFLGSFLLLCPALAEATGNGNGSSFPSGDPSLST